MSEELPEKPKKLTTEEKNKLLLIDSIIRMNADIDPKELEEKDIPVLEYIYQAEKLRSNKKKEDPKPTFLSKPIKHTPDPVPTEKKENKEITEFKFNALEVFKSQFTPIERLNYLRQGPDAEIFTMRISANPKYPEWQVS